MRRRIAAFSAWILTWSLAGCGQAAGTAALIAAAAPTVSASPALASPAPSAPPSDAASQQAATVGETDDQLREAIRSGDYASGTDAVLDPPPVASSVPALPSDLETPPQYPKAIDRASRDAELEAQEAAYIDPVLTASARTVIADLKALGIDDVDLYHGTHIVLQGDRGSHYARWSGPGQDVVKRISSHASKAQQYQITTGFRQTGILFGTTDAGDTWVQFERHAFFVEATGIHKLIGIASNLLSAHAADYLIYRRTHEQVGPLGLSPYTDSNPLLQAAWPSPAPSATP